jgi:hypothetical protein
MAKARPKRRPRRRVSAQKAVAKPAQTKNSIRIRMYRQGLGDCFLVGLPKDDHSLFWMMIDCGVILGTKDPETKMKAVVKDIIQQTTGRIDLLIVTHEHWDHLSGFIQAQDLFNANDQRGTPGKLSIEEVWFAWTEDPNDELAKSLRRDREQRLQKLTAFVGAMSRPQTFSRYDEEIRADVSRMTDGIAEVLSFFGVRENRKSTNSTTAALDFVRTLSNKIRYCRPADEPKVLPEVAGARIYVFGPPQEQAMLRKTDSKTEVYHLADAGTALSFFAAATQVLEPMAEDENPQDVRDEFDRNQPFDGAYRRPLSVLRNLARGDQPVDATWEFFYRYYFGKTPDLIPGDQFWRRIDATWFDSAAEFALQLDSATNNTSLVIAIELIKSGKVLLFVGDAQVGNWLSWQDLSWKIGDKKVTATDLLRRTHFYKVGHHGSHNATLKTNGLELMPTDDFVAFIPVDHKMALKKGWAKMPLRKLLDELESRTKGRLVRADQPYKGPGFPALSQSDLCYEWQVSID